MFSSESTGKWIEYSDLLLTELTSAKLTYEQM